MKYMMLIICSVIRMCELKYIGNFNTVLFIKPMKDVELALSGKYQNIKYMSFIVYLGIV